MKRSKGPAWRADVDRRLAELERGLKAERATREHQGARDDEEMQTIHDTLNLIREEQRGWQQRLEWLEKRFSSTARPRKPSRKS